MVQELQAAPIEKRLLALEIQEELLKRIGYAEALIRQARKANKEIKAALSRPGNSRENSRAFRARYDVGEARINQQKTLISVLRSVGDAIPFVYGDRWDLKHLAMKEDAGFITGKRGTRLERTSLRRAFALGGAAVMNDLTHTLRHGDICVFRRLEGDSPFLLLELKTGRGGAKSRAERQKLAMTEIVHHLSQDTREVDGYLWQRISPAEVPEYHCNTATKLMTDLPRTGRIIQEVEPGLHYVLLDGGYIETLNDIVRSLLDNKGSMFGLSVNLMKHCQFGYYPFTLSIRNPDALFRFYNDECFMFVFVSMAHVNNALASEGISITVGDDVLFPWLIFVPGDGIGTDSTPPARLSAHALGRFASEFVRLDWFVKNMIGGPACDAMRQYLAG